MPYGPAGYEARARECVRLANQAADRMVQMELLRLRQTYLAIADRLLRQSGDQTAGPAAGIPPH